MTIDLHTSVCSNECKLTLHGEKPSKETVALMLKERGKLAGDKKLTEEYIQKIGFKSFDDLAEAIINGKVEYGKLPGYATPVQTAPANQRVQGKNQEKLQCGRRSRLSRRKN